MQEDEQTVQRIYDILAEYAEQLRNSPDLNNKPAPRRRSNPPTNPPATSASSSPPSSSTIVSSPSNVMTIETVQSKKPRKSGKSDTFASGSGNESGGEESQHHADVYDSQSSNTDYLNALVSPDDGHTIIEPIPTRCAIQDGRRLITIDSVASTKIRTVLTNDGKTVNNERPATAVLMPGNFIVPMNMVNNQNGQQITLLSSAVNSAIQRMKNSNNSGCETNGNTILLQGILPKQSIVTKQAGGGNSVGTGTVVVAAAPGNTNALKSGTVFWRAIPSGTVTAAGTNLNLNQSQVQPQRNSDNMSQSIVKLVDNSNVDERNIDDRPYSVSAFARVPQQPHQQRKFDETTTRTPIATTTPITYQMSSKKRKLNESYQEQRSQPILVITSAASSGRNKAVNTSSISTSTVQPTITSALWSSAPQMQTQTTTRVVSEPLNTSNNIFYSRLPKTEQFAEEYEIMSTPAAVIMAAAGPSPSLANQKPPSLYIDRIASTSVHNSSFTAESGRGNGGILLQQLCNSNITMTSERNKQATAAIFERELRLQKSLSEECEDLGVDEPSTSDLFPEADLLFDNVGSTYSPAFDSVGSNIFYQDSTSMLPVSTNTAITTTMSPVMSKSRIFFQTTTAQQPQKQHVGETRVITAPSTITKMANTLRSSNPNDNGNSSTIGHGSVISIAKIVSTTTPTMTTMPNYFRVENSTTSTDGKTCNLFELTTNVDCTPITTTATKSTTVARPINTLKRKSAKCVQLQAQRSPAQGIELIGNTLQQRQSTLVMHPNSTKMVVISDPTCDINSIAK